MRHKCYDTWCICPIHKTALLYASSIDKHACQDINCQYAQGIEMRTLYAYRNRFLSNIFKQYITDQTI